MKPKVLACVFLLVLILALLTTSAGYYVGFRRGHVVGQQLAENFRVNNFITSFDVLEKLRSSNYTGAIERLEPFCYSSFIDAFEGTKSNLVSLYTPQLINYRATYANPKTEQYPTEQKLDLLLRDKSPNR